MQRVADGFCIHPRARQAAARRVGAGDRSVSGRSAPQRRSFGPTRRAARSVGLAAALAIAGVTPASGQSDDERGNWFGDPFVALTAGIVECPVPPGPSLTRAQVRAEAHDRAQRGTSCFAAGRCRLPNAYLYDAEIAPRVKKSIAADGRFADTSLWATAQRRWVWIDGCVGRAEQIQDLERLLRQIDDVEGVVVRATVRSP